MSLKKMHLRKILTLMFAEDAKKVSMLRADIREEIGKRTGAKIEGGDFHAPFWHDAKAHVNGENDLRLAVIQRIATNNRRERLYTALRDGFLDWWDNKRRWTNEASKSQMLAVKGALDFPELQCTVKVENLLAMTIGRSKNRIIYPYFSEEPSLSSDAARLGLWAIITSVDEYPPDEFRILDVIRGQSFAASDLAFSGLEREEFVSRYSSLLVMWEKLWMEYEPA
ncbi:hypothetical protein LB523_10035 [Mesorhizobium sp. ESP-6-4]|uniref:hypothetical protein n=1 Tax=Mesorhizobium sp. ESP-6-4 TaxID=2876624 RepID=UPI001CCB973D|nr:hypothetical protein [Mesorhizobium sp. ESP-6-4]MBZ9659384.1 hypothetical protein [Mesorhizobium sp. ESP-6-4]